MGNKGAGAIERNKTKNANKVIEEIGSLGFVAALNNDPCRNRAWFVTLTRNGTYVGTFWDKEKRMSALFRARNWAREVVQAGGKGDNDTDG